MRLIMLGPPGAGKEPKVDARRALQVPTLPQAIYSGKQSRNLPHWGERPNLILSGGNWYPMKLLWRLCWSGSRNLTVGRVLSSMVFPVQ